MTDPPTRNVQKEGGAVNASKSWNERRRTMSMNRGTNIACLMKKSPCLRWSMVSSTILIMMIRTQKMNFLATSRSMSTADMAIAFTKMGKYFTKTRILVYFFDKEPNLEVCPSGSKTSAMEVPTKAFHEVLTWIIIFGRLRHQQYHDHTRRQEHSGRNRASTLGSQSAISSRLNLTTLRGPRHRRTYS